MSKHNPYKTTTGVHIEWFTVRRSTIYALFFLLLALVGASTYGYFQIFGDDGEEPVVEQVRKLLAE